MKCPLGCDLTEYRILGFLTGMQYGCQGGKSDSAIWVKEYAAWLCMPAFREVLRMRVTKTQPDVDRAEMRELQDNTRMIRASVRPHRLRPRTDTRVV